MLWTGFVLLTLLWDRDLGGLSQAGVPVPGVGPRGVAYSLWALVSRLTGLDELCALGPPGQLGCRVWAEALTWGGVSLTPRLGEGSSPCWAGVWTPCVSADTDFKETERHPVFAQAVGLVPLQTVCGTWGPGGPGTGGLKVPPGQPVWPWQVPPSRLYGQVPKAGVLSS